MNSIFFIIVHHPRTDRKNFRSLGLGFYLTLNTGFSTTERDFVLAKPMESEIKQIDYLGLGFNNLTLKIFKLGQQRSHRLGFFFETVCEKQKRRSGGSLKNQVHQIRSNVQSCLDRIKTNREHA